MRTRDRQDAYAELRGWLERQRSSVAYGDAHPGDPYGDAELELCSDEIDRLCLEILGDSVVKRSSLESLERTFLNKRDMAAQGRGARLRLATAWEMAASLVRELR